MLAGFYNTQAGIGSEVLFSVPYHDGFGFGMVISACLPVHDTDGTFKGVSCVDILMRDLIAELTAFDAFKGEVFYPFMLDKFGKGKFSSSCSPLKHISINNLI